MDFSSLEIKRTKIFKSIYDLQYRDPKLEERYQLIAKVNLKNTFNLFSQFLLFFGIFLCTLEGVLFFSEKQIDNRNLKYNFYFALVHLSITIGIFMYVILKEKIENKFMKNFCLLVIHFCYNNFFLSLISIIIVYFKTGIELVSFTFILQILTNILLSFFLHKNFWTSFVICMFNLTFEYSFLLGIHVIKGIIYYLIVHTAFTIISLGFVYMYEFMTRKFYFSFLKLAKEKDYFLETIEFFNISYFATRNKTIKRVIKMDYILDKEDHDINDKSSDDQKITLKSIEKVMKNLISIEHFSKDIDNYLTSSRNKKNFQFKKLIKIITSNEENKHYFKKFTNLGILFLKNNNSEESFFQMFMKIKIKKFSMGMCDNESDIDEHNIIYKNFDVKIECILLDVSQSLLKKENQLNSIVLSKYINDIKCPLFLLGQIISEYKCYMHKMKKSLPHAYTRSNSEIDEYSNNLRIVSDNFNENIELINNFAKKQNSLNSYRVFLDWQQVDIRKFINVCIEFYSLNSKLNKNKQNIRVYSVIDNNIPEFVFTIESYLKQILMNLLSNALKFTFNGEIKVVLKMKSKLELTHDRNFLEINVIDTGVGIDEDNLDRICDQNELLLSNKFQGAGLGLIIVTDLLKKINSKLCVCSVRNKGSNFSFEIPITKDCNRNELLLENTYSTIKPKKQEIKIKKIRMIPENNLNDKGDYSSHVSKVIDPDVKFKDKALDEENELLDKKTVLFTQPSRQELEEISKKYKNFLNSDKKRSNSKDNLKNYFNIENEKLIIENQIMVNKKYKRRNSFLASYQLPQPHSAVNLYKNRFLLNEECANQNIVCCKCMSSEEEKKVPDNITFINNSLEKASLSKSALNIFVIDDDTTYLRHTLSQIKMISLELNISIKDRTACDAIEGMWKIYEDFKNKHIVYDLIIIDENMPFLSGSTFVKMFNENLVCNGFYKVPFISVSSEKVRIATQKNDSATNYFDSFLTKPCRQSVLKNIILKYIDAKKNS